MLLAILKEFTQHELSYNTGIHTCVEKRKSSFENWMQIEIASKLASEVENLIIEDYHMNNADLSFIYQNKQYALELKVKIIPKSYYKDAPDSMALGKSLLKDLDKLCVKAYHQTILFIVSYPIDSSNTGWKKAVEKRMGDAYDTHHVTQWSFTFKQISNDSTISSASAMLIYPIGAAWVLNLQNSV